MWTDIHNHCLPQEYLDLLRKWNKPVTVTEENDRTIVKHNHGSFTLFDGWTDVEPRLKWMDENDIDKTVVSISTPSPEEGPFTVDETVELCRTINDAYADLQAEHPDRIAGLGVLPLRDPEAALEELDRINGELDLAGVGLRTRSHGKLWSDPEIEPVFDRIDELDVSAFLHPLPNELSTDLTEEEWIMNPMSVFVVDTTHQICRLIWDGFFDRHDFPLVLPHLGGTIPYLVGRWDNGRDEIGSYKAMGPDRSFYDYIQDFYYDTIIFHRPALRCALETVGADHLLFGTDFPFPIENAGKIQADVESLGLSDDDLDGVKGGTAKELFNI